jgi:hypothetical protein
VQLISPTIGLPAAHSAPQSMAICSCLHPFASLPLAAPKSMACATTESAIAVVVIYSMLLHLTMYLCSLAHTNSCLSRPPFAGSLAPKILILLRLHRESDTKLFLACASSYKWKKCEKVRKLGCALCNAGSRVRSISEASERGTSPFSRLSQMPSFCPASGKTEAAIVATEYYSASKQILLAL